MHREQGKLGPDCTNGFVFHEVHAQSSYGVESFQGKARVGTYHAPPNLVQGVGATGPRPG